MISPHTQTEWLKLTISNVDKDMEQRELLCFTGFGKTAFAISAKAKYMYTSWCTAV